MTKNAKILMEVLRGVSDANIAFGDLLSLLQNLGFTERIRGSHHIFSNPDVEEILNIQPIGNKAKPYQVKQVRNIILKYKMDIL
jgi:predicted RNA binding protein YcfA (HicA-like mRNA interferase family)